MADSTDKPDRPPGAQQTLFEVLSQLTAAGASDEELQRAAEQYLLDHQGSWAPHVDVAVDLARRVAMELPAGLSRVGRSGAAAAHVHSRLSVAALTLGRDVLPSEPAVDDVELGAYQELCAQLLEWCRRSGR